MYNSGYDYFTAGPDTIDEMVCKVCGTLCDVKRNILGATGWACAVAKQKVLHDSFTCPNVNQQWHIQALGLVKDIGKCNSPSLRKIMSDDLKKMIQKKEVINEN